MSLNIFSCQNCCHAIMENCNQVGCSLHKLEKIPYNFNETTKFFDLGKVCFYKDKQENNIFIKFGYIFILDDKDKLPELKNNLEKVLSLKPMWIGISNDFPELGNEINSYLIDAQTPYNIVSNYEKIAGDIYRFDQFMSNYKNGWTFVNIAGKELDISLSSALNNYVNNFNPIALVKHKCESVNGFAFFNMIYKYLKGSYPSVLDDDTIVQKTFIEKINEVSPDMLKEWNDLNEIHSNSNN